MKNHLLCMILCSAMVVNLNAQTSPKYPFPQNVKYPHGNMTTVISNDFVKNWYDNWKKKYLQRCSNSIRPGVDPLSKSLVEAQGFAMVAVAYMGDKDIFDSLYTYYKSKQTTQGCGLMGWKVDRCNNFVDKGSATDGDIDVACALIVADWQWPESGYKEKANELIKTLKRMITNCNGKLTVYPGCNGSPWGGCNETDISYYAPSFFRYFAEVSGDKDWAKLADDTHIIRDAAANGTTGLVPDWQSVDGRAGAGSRKGYFSFDAIRAPYKQTMDFLWHGNEKAGTWAKKLTTWAYGFGVKKIVDGFNLNGTVNGSNHNMATVGSMAVAAMANTQEVLDAFAEDVLTLKDEYWYSGYLGNLYLLALTGNMWTPEIIGTNVKNDLVKSKSVSKNQVKIFKKTNRNFVVSSIPKNSTITLTSLAGKVIFSVANLNAESVNINSIQSGCYVFTVRNNRGVNLESRMLPVY